MISDLPYTLEPLELPEPASDNDGSGTLKLANPISSAGTLDFLLRRENSSRGEFQSSRRGNDRDQQREMDNQLTVQVGDGRQSRQSATPSSLTSPRWGPARNDLSFTSLQKSPLPLESPSSAEEPTLVTARFQIERLHRIKPKWPAWLLMRRDNFIEIVQRETCQQLLQRQKSTGSQFHLLGIEEPQGKGGKRRKPMRIFIGQIGSTDVLPAERGACWSPWAVPVGN